MTLVTPRIYGLLTSLCVPLAKLYLKKSVKKGLTDSADSGIIIPFSKRRYSSVAQWQSTRLLTELL